jgi:hypothetical protein
MTRALWFPPGCCAAAAVWLGIVERRPDGRAAGYGTVGLTNGRAPDEQEVVVRAVGVWQLRQLSRTGACSHRNGPRFSAWHAVHVSLTLSQP